MEEIKGLDRSPEWCKKCSNHLSLDLLKQVIDTQRWGIGDFVIVSGIGNSAKIPVYLNCNSFMAPPGEAISVACGIKAANHNLKVIVLIGDGDLLSGGLRSYIHSARRNIDINVLILNNLILCTTGDYPSPCSPNDNDELFRGLNVFNPLSIVKLSIASEVGFVSRGATARLEHLKELVNRAIDHKGFSMVEILEPCRNHYNLDFIMDLEKKFYNIDENNSEPDDLEKACRNANEKDRIPLGLIYRAIKSTYIGTFPQLAEDTLVNQLISRKKLDAFLQKFLKF